MSEISVNRVRSLVYNSFVYSARLTGKHVLINDGWQKLFKLSCRHFSGPVRSLINKRAVVLNYGYTYPINVRMFRLYNAPLVELAHQVFQTAGRAVAVVDVGAAIGDTVLLLVANLPAAFSAFYCIEGDREFFTYLKENLAALPQARLYPVLLSSDDNEPINTLVRHHTGSASAQGGQQQSAVTLDTLLSSVERIDLLKIDVDGFDGEVLAGAGRILEEQQPAVIFEWHPLLLERTGNSPQQPFQVLNACGYEQFVWYTKFGAFSHFTHGYCPTTVQRFAEYCHVRGADDDWHYDVIALPKDSPINPTVLANLPFARSRPLHK